MKYDQTVVCQKESSNDTVLLTFLRVYTQVEVIVKCMWKLCSSVDLVTLCCTSKHSCWGQERNSKQMLFQRLSLWCPLFFLSLQLKGSRIHLFLILFLPLMTVWRHRDAEGKERKENGIRTGRDHLEKGKTKGQMRWWRWRGNVGLRKLIQGKDTERKVGGRPLGSWRGQQLIRMRGRGVALMATVSGTQKKPVESPQRWAQYRLVDTWRKWGWGGEWDFAF